MIRAWLASLLCWLLVPMWRRLAGPGPVALHVQVLARTERGRVVYQLLDGEGKPATGEAFTGLMVAVADLAEWHPGIAPATRRDCKKLGKRLHAELEQLTKSKTRKAAA